MKLDKLRLDGVTLIFKNFRGEKGQFNEAGNRTFSIYLDDMDLIEDLQKDGWAVKFLRNEDGEITGGHLQVKLNYASRYPPRVHKVVESNRTPTALSEATVEMLDYLPIKSADVILNPYEWNVRGESGIKAYLDTMYAVIEENELDLKWANYADED